MSEKVLPFRPPQSLADWGVMTMDNNSFEALITGLQEEIEQLRLQTNVSPEQEFEISERKLAIRALRAIQVGRCNELDCILSDDTSMSNNARD